MNLSKRQMYRLCIKKWKLKERIRRTMQTEILNEQTELKNVIKTLSAEYASLIDNNIDPKVYFKKKKYSEYFENYCSEHEAVFKHIREMLNFDESTDNNFSQEQQQALKEIANALAEKAKQEIDSLKGMKKGNRQSELNLFLVTSVFPCTLKLGNEYGEELCKALAAAWKKEFPGNEISYTSYEKLSEGFRSFWGFLTGR